MIQETPIPGKIYKVKLDSGRTWLFKSAYKNHHLTEYSGCYCYNSGGDSYFENIISNDIGCHIGNNSDILLLTPANENEIVIFKSKLCL